MAASWFVLFNRAVLMQDDLFLDQEHKSAGRKLFPVEFGSSHTPESGVRTSEFDREQFSPRIFVFLF